MVTFFRANLLWSEGFYIFLVLVFLGLISFILYRPLFYFVITAFVFSLWFFRNPSRVFHQGINDQSVIVCPADGKVVDIQFDSKDGFEGFSHKISIFLSPFDVHVNWIPMTGEVKKINYRSGQFKLAFLPKASEFNERNDLLLSSVDGKTILVRQIAGIIARRICCWVLEGDKVKLGQKYGMIRFGSRVDIFLPKNVDLVVGVGQRVYGGQTVLGRWT